MPDHIHMLWIGLAQNSDQKVAIEFFRKHLRSHLAPFGWDHQPFDNVLREKDRERDAFQATAFYILENPVRAELVKMASDYKFSGAIVLGYPDLSPFQKDFWEKFWKIDSLLRS